VGVKRNSLDLSTILSTILSTAIKVILFKNEDVMNNVSYSSFRNSLATFLDKVNEDHQPILITRQNGSPAVLMSLEDFHSYEETFYLMASRKNAKRLNRSIHQIESGMSQQHGLLEDEEN
jgi:antitoxin YefM